MCIVSMVIDHYQPIIPNWEPAAPTPPAQSFTWPGIDLAELRKLIAEFKEALAAAKSIDRLTGQPDCEDPEKAKLIARVVELEALLARKPVAWIIKRSPKHSYQYLVLRGGVSGAWGEHRANAVRYRDRDEAEEALALVINGDPSARIVGIVKKARHGK